MDDGATDGAGTGRGHGVDNDAENRDNDAGDRYDDDDKAERLLEIREKNGTPTQRVLIDFETGEPIFLGDDDDDFDDVGNDNDADGENDVGNGDKGADASNGELNDATTSRIRIVNDDGGMAKTVSENQLDDNNEVEIINCHPGNDQVTNNAADTTKTSGPSMPRTYQKYQKSVTVKTSNGPMTFLMQKSAAETPSSPTKSQLGPRTLLLPPASQTTSANRAFVPIRPFPGALKTSVGIGKGGVTPATPAGDQDDDQAMKDSLSNHPVKKQLDGERNTLRDYTTTASSGSTGVRLRINSTNVSNFKTAGASGPITLMELVNRKRKADGSLLPGDQFQLPGGPSGDFQQNGVAVVSDSSSPSLGTPSAKKPHLNTPFSPAKVYTFKNSRVPRVDMIQRRRLLDRHRRTQQKLASLTAAIKNQDSYVASLPPWQRDNLRKTQLQMQLQERLLARKMESFLKILPKTTAIDSRQPTPNLVDVDSVRAMEETPALTAQPDQQQQQQEQQQQAPTWEVERSQESQPTLITVERDSRSEDDHVREFFWERYGVNFTREWR